MTEFCLVLQVALGIIFVLSSAGKLLNPKGFARGFADYRILPASWGNLASVFIIAQEIVLAITHLTGYLLSIALPFGLVLLGAFVIAVSVNLNRGRPLPCYCLGRSGEIISRATLGKLVLLMLGEAFLVRADLPIHPHQIALSELSLGSFWAIFLILSGFWLLALGDLIRLIRSMQ